VRNVSLPGGTSTITLAAIDQTVTIPPNVTINTANDLQNLTDGIAQNGLTIQQFQVTVDALTGGACDTTKTITAGQSTSFCLPPLTPEGGPVQGSGTLTLTCGNGPTTPTLDSLKITCTVAPPSFVIGSATTPNLLISTAGTTFSMASPEQRPGTPFYAVWVAFLGMPVVGVVFIGSKRRRWLKLVFGVGLLALLMGSQTACGGGGGGAPHISSVGTPRGTYEI